MVDVSVLPPVVEAQYDGSTWTEVTDDLRGLEAGHGAARLSNPDRPTVASAEGGLLLSGEISDRTRGRRFPCRIRLGTTVLWNGWMQEPQAAATPDPAVQWRLAGRLGEHLQRAADISPASRTIAASIADTNLWTRLVGAAPSAAQLPTRTLKAHTVSERVGRYISQFAAVANAAAVERLDGTLRFTAATLTTEPAGTPTLDGLAVLVNKVTTRDRADRVRNEVRAEVISPGPGTVETRTARLRIDYDGRGTTRTAGTSSQDPDWQTDLNLAGTLALPDDGTTKTIVAAAIFASGVRAAIAGTVTTHPQAGSPMARIDTIDDIAADVNPAGTPTATLNDDGETVAVAVTIGDDWPPLGGGGTGRAGHILRWTVAGVGRANDAGLIHSDSTMFYGANIAVNSIITTSHILRRVSGIYVCVDVTYRATAPSTIITPTTYRAATSVAQWGVRPLELPDWLAAGTALQAQIDALGDLVHEHTLEVPLRQPSAAAQTLVAGLDAGDYVSVVINDPGRNIAINAVCLVAGRSIVYTPRTGAVLRFRCLETGATPGAPTEAPATPTGLAAAALTETSLAVSCDTTTGAASYQFRHRVDGTSAWTVVDAGMAPLATISGLTASTTYEVQVRARNAVGDSAWSSSVDVDTPAPPVAAPHTPTGLNVSAVSSSSVSAAYMAAATGGAASSFQLRHRIGTAAWTVVDVDPPLAGSMTITGLTASTTYEVQVRARNAVGDSPWSSGVNVTTTSGTTGPTRPTTPTNLTLQPVGTTVTAVVDTVAGATGYGWRIREQGDSQWQTSTTSAATQTIPGLTAGATYEIQARASNSAGDSPWTATRTVTISATPPGPIIQELRRRQSGQVYDLLVRFQSQRTSGTVASYLQGVRPRSSATDQNPSWKQELTRTTSNTFNNRWFLGIPPSTQYEIYGSVTYTDGVTSEVTVVQLATPILSGESYPARTLTLDAAPVTVDDNPIALRETTTIEERSDD